MRGQDIEAAIELSLEEAHHGTTRTITLQTTTVCPTCNGSGVQENQPCATCRGIGMVTRPKTLDVTIPAGVRHGSVIRLADRVKPVQARRPPATCCCTSSSDPMRFFTYWTRAMWR